MSLETPQCFLSSWKNEPVKDNHFRLSWFVYVHGTSKSTLNVYIVLLFPFAGIYTYMFAYTCMCF